ncbi:XRE family transcriptional regulator [Hominisplanchenecus murintestinalis]|uniref:XRE family transcriptional regulator n=1 Tax=Hominisplanchenecus murintestinalis TaxID=2941517 RepID=A0AC61QVW2_9FIRM|nr:helix-turn-helix transcriptional regulator [Hominisplanchenecus murintestinalis]NBH99502.1 XRE family transcriptional regulator [Lachnospiraceae bacterium]NBI76766.1 XRE family transcriptional regulator [Lachnospiraceae bacterium]RKJ78924.1 XRE family transcriptional regulator [Anaerotruncus sp. 1XD22-93]TGX96836.1 XRE family transcriptional regulator [Hominisplanchenecus murintestinalis]
MKNRILKIRKDNKLTQDAFAERLNLSKNFVWMLEKGERIASDRTIADICREFSVNERWIRTGEGEMYKEIEDEVAEVVSELLEESNPFYDLIIGIMETYQGLDSKSQELLKNSAQRLLDNLKKRD